jgi:hypothetical protein
MIFLGAKRIIPRKYGDFLNERKQDYSNYFENCQQKGYLLKFLVDHSMEVADRECRII